MRRQSENYAEQVEDQFEAKNLDLEGEVNFHLSQAQTDKSYKKIILIVCPTV